MLHCPIKRVLQESYPQFEILTAVDVHSAMRLVEYYNNLQCYFNLVLLELDIPQNPGSPANFKNGIELVRTLIQADTPPDNMVVSSTKVMSLVRIKTQITNKYTGGFAASDKFSSDQDLINLVESAFRGSIYLPKKLRSPCNCNNNRVDLSKLNPIWIKMLELNCEDGFTEPAIAIQLDLSIRTLNNYWDYLGDALGICKQKIPKEEKDLTILKNEKDFKIQIAIRARQLGLIG